MPAATGLKPTGEVPLLIELQLPTASGSTPHPLSYHLLQRLSHLISSQACLGAHTLPAVSQCPLLGICVLPHPFDWQVAPTLDIIEAMAATRSVGVREAAQALALCIGPQRAAMDRTTQSRPGQRGHQDPDG